MLKFYCLITGDEYELIKNETPNSKKKVRLLSISLIIPVLLWAIQSFLLTSQVLKCSFTTSLVAMVICSIIIFVIEKAIVMSNGSIPIAAFRIILGLIIASIGSLTLDEVIFKNDIDTQISENKTIYVSEALELKKQNLNKEFLKIESDVKAKEENWKVAYDEAVGEYDGSRGSGIPGIGKRVSLKMQRTDELKSELEKAKTDMNLEKAKTESELLTYKENVSNSYNENSLLLRINALFDLIGKDGWMKLIYILFTLL
ncbi:MAG: DUF4407 domain-containing protein, partial [Ignavibacteria bacterium]|nr:DUF4407 domain-containing protein [Ignavibacteria bacterium]